MKASFNGINLNVLMLWIWFNITIVFACDDSKDLIYIKQGVTKQCSDSDVTKDSDYCKSWVKFQEACPFSCGLCASTPSSSNTTPTITPPKTCDDSKDLIYIKKGVTKKCSDSDVTKDSNYCNSWEVFKKRCPFSCGLCPSTLAKPTKSPIRQPKTENPTRELTKETTEPTVFAKCKMPVEESVCPQFVDPYLCGTIFKCEYLNFCLAKAVGYKKKDCKPLRPRTRSPTMEPIKKSTKKPTQVPTKTPSVNEGCPILKNGLVCPAVDDPYVCGTNLKCEYSNFCLAKAVGYKGRDCEPLRPNGTVCTDKVGEIYIGPNLQSCQWLSQQDQALKNNYCNWGKVKRHCGRTCSTDCDEVVILTSKPTVGPECVDNEGVINMGESDARSCEWLSKSENKKNKCTWRNIKEHCHKTCSTCGGIVPTSEPTRTPLCEDRKEAIPMGEGSDLKTCTWLAAQVFKKVRCTWKKIKAHCLMTCTTCGGPDTSTLAPTSEPECKDKLTPIEMGEGKGIGTKKTCAWLAEQSVQKSRCTWKSIKSHCVKTCTGCEVCEDTLKNFYTDKGMVYCDIIIKYPDLSEEMCRGKESSIFRVKCPQSCGECDKLTMPPSQATSPPSDIIVCEDKTGDIEIPQIGMKNCHWLAKKTAAAQKDDLCKLSGIWTFCRKTCTYCDVTNLSMRYD